MKNFCITFFVFFIIIATVIFAAASGGAESGVSLSSHEAAEFLRIHVRANSD